MARIDLYKNVHKGQRAALFGLATALGCVDPTDGAARVELAARLRAMVAELHEHADNEETFIHPLLQAHAPEIVVLLESGHRQVEAALTEVESALRRFEAAEDTAVSTMELYRSWCRLVSTYLAHLDAEERLAMSALWRSCSDQEILTVIRQFLASRRADALLKDLRSQAPALAPQERTDYVGAMVRGGAVAAEQVWNSLRDVLPAAELSRLRADLASQPS